MDDLSILLKNIRQGKNAKESAQKIILHHMDWALGISWAHIRKFGCYSLRDDLNSEALLGLSIGVSRLEGMKHDNVTGFLSYFVVNRLLEYMHRSPTVRVPRNRKPVFTVPIRKYEGVYSNGLNTKEFIGELTLSDTERQFAEWRVEGYSFREIADFLEVSLAQVYVIRKRMQKRYDMNLPPVRVPCKQNPVDTGPILQYDGGKKADINADEFIDELTETEEERKLATWRVEGHSLPEIADFLGVSLARVYKIRKRIRDRYDERKRNY